MSNQVLTCVISHHRNSPQYQLDSEEAFNVEEIVMRIKQAHTANCDCGASLGEEVWIANISWPTSEDQISNGIASSYELLRPHMLMDAVFTRVAAYGVGFAAKVHLVVAGESTLLISRALLMVS